VYDAALAQRHPIRLPSSRLAAVAETPPSRPGDIALRCHHCGKLTDVRTTGRGEEFLHRCRHCHGYHKFTSVGHHGSGAIHYRVTKVAAPAPEEKTTAVT